MGYVRSIKKQKTACNYDQMTFKKKRVRERERKIVGNFMEHKEFIDWFVGLVFFSDSTTCWNDVRK